MLLYANVIEFLLCLCKNIKCFRILHHDHKLSRQNLTAYLFFDVKTDFLHSISTQIHWNQAHVAGWTAEILRTFVSASCRLSIRQRTGYKNTAFNGFHIGSGYFFQISHNNIFFWISNISMRMFRLPMVVDSSYSKEWHSSSVAMGDNKNSIRGQYLPEWSSVPFWKLSLDFS
jgi:hypothetical protein